jgi:hypothetical protein
VKKLPPKTIISNTIYKCIKGSVQILPTILFLRILSKGLISQWELTSKRSLTPYMDRK